MNVNTYFGNGLPYKSTSLPQVELFLDEKILQQPLHWRKPQQIFVCSMTDLFGRFVPDEWILAVMNVIRAANDRGHVFQVLTKRPERMRTFMSRLQFDHAGAGRMFLEDRGNNRQDRPICFAPLLTRLWLGTSVEDQQTADERIPELLETPAAKHWVSAEPLLAHLHLCGLGGCCGWRSFDLDWIVIGGESGTGARPFHVEWARSILEQMKMADVPVASFVKQLGANPFADGVPMTLKDKKGGEISEWPEDLQVREFPA